MKNNEKTIGMIGFRPTMLESIKISYISEVFNLNRCAVLRDLLTGHWTLDELHALARITGPNKQGIILPYLKKVYSPGKSIEDLVRSGDKLYAKEILGIGETEWEFIDDKESN